MVGYETKKEVLFSLRSKLNIDLNKLIKECLVDFDGSGGGHPKAIGGKIVKEQFEKLVEKIQVTLNN
jgi:nanoRNase/pAp phosphatase (c-di-AMP/oligoRNAs hydrolase)